MAKRNRQWREVEDARKVLTDLAHVLNAAAPSLGEVPYRLEAEAVAADAVSIPLPFGDPPDGSDLNKP